MINVALTNKSLKVFQDTRISILVVFQGSLVKLPLVHTVQQERKLCACLQVMLVQKHNVYMCTSMKQFSNTFTTAGKLWRARLLLKLSCVDGSISKLGIESNMSYHERDTAKPQYIVLKWY